jgi:hypothetical protein
MVRLAALLLAAVVLLGALVWAACGYLGRTPAELIDYTKRRLQGHAQLERISLPVLELLRRGLADQDEVELALPFAVPPRPANPALAGTAPAGDDPRIIRVGPGRSITRIAVAAQMAVDGSVIEIDAGDYVADVAVWSAAGLTIRGLGDRVRLIAGGADAEGKAIWVFRSPRATVENIEFVGARVADRNGAGIRLESGHLVVRRCTFWGSENGILASSEPGTQLEVENSEFGYNGAGDGLSHAIYVGAIDSFRLTGSYLHHGNVGHLLKSRARLNRVEYNRLSDESGGRSSYEMEFPNGGIAEVVGNVVQQGSGARNSIMVSFGAEGYRWPRNELRFVHNTVVNDLKLGGSFLRVLPGAQAVVLRNNLFVGPGKVDGSAVLDAAGDRDASWGDLLRPSREDYRPGERARTAWAAVPLAAVEPAWAPRFEYLHPAATRPITGPPALPGALQAGPP